MKTKESNNTRSWMETHTVVYSNKDVLLGEIQQIHLGFGKTLGGEPTAYVVSRAHCRNLKTVYTKEDALIFLGVGKKEINDYYEVVYLTSIGFPRIRNLLRRWICDHKCPVLDNKIFCYKNTWLTVSSTNKDNCDIEVNNHYYTYNTITK